MASILIVDDDDLILHLYELAFKNEGLDVHLARNGSEALTVVETHLPETMLLDIMMPEMSGIDVLQKMRENPKYQQIKVFILTNLLDQKMKDEAYRLGAKDYIIKSDFTPIEIVKKVKDQIPQMAVEPTMNPVKPTS